MDRFFRSAVEAVTEARRRGPTRPFGAAVVRGDEVLVAAANQQLAERDPSQHAEMVAIRRACRMLDTMDLSDCTVYATCEPCPMCLSVMIWAGIKECYYSATREDAELQGFSDLHLRRFLAGQDGSVLRLMPVGQRQDCTSLFDLSHQRDSGRESMP